MEFLNSINWTAILGAGIPILLGIGFIWNRMSRVLLAMKEMGQMLIVISESLSDKELTKEEITFIKKEAREAFIALRNIIGK